MVLPDGWDDFPWISLSINDHFMPHGRVNISTSGHFSFLQRFCDFISIEHSLLRDVILFCSWDSDSTAKKTCVQWPDPLPSWTCDVCLLRRLLKLPRAPSCHICISSLLWHISNSSLMLPFTLCILRTSAPITYWTREAGQSHSVSVMYLITN